LDLNKRIAERRAELQKEQAAEEEIRKKEEQEKKDLQIAEEKAKRELVEKEAELKIQQINSRLQGAGEEIPHSDDTHETSQERKSDPFEEDRNSINEEAQKRADAHIRNLASKRMTKEETMLICMLFFGGIMGFFLAWWIGLAIWGCAAYYASKVTDAHIKDIKAELADK